VIDGGDLSVSTQAASQGAYRLKALVDDTNSIYAIDKRPVATSQYTATVDLKLSSFSSRYTTIFRGYDAQETPVFEVFVCKSSTSLNCPIYGGMDAPISGGSKESGPGQLSDYIWAAVRTDSWVWRYPGTPISINRNVINRMRVDWKAAGASGANNVQLILKVGTAQRTVTWLDNDLDRVGEARLGALVIEPITGGWHGIDAFDSSWGSPISVTISISYTYDELNRLTNTIYSSGPAFTYTLDAVGNRLTQIALLGGTPETTTYLYDHANRLANVNGAGYTWDATATCCGMGCIPTPTRLLTGWLQ
jgi:hypothetical protein